ncbi:hypothetical protein SAY87_019258 [Trapa incisa]|uniref:Uncharacterized protein n=2 Tax=Trapa TaxID=22665 RepID=A0AAN7LY35_TRANT|nr:hypothetical protein SAY87_019258 [Trapa incisa]KAK4793439.1 hypothetical protein SAY86_023874 [Trapa natans]
MDKFRSFSSILLVSKRLFSSTQGTSPELPFTVHYLVNRCGIPLEAAITAAKKVQLRESATGNAEFVLSFFKSYGFGDTQLATLITRRPKILLCRPNTTLKPKMDFFIENGFEGPFLHELIVRNPSVLRRSVKSQLEPVFDFLRTYIHTFEELRIAIRRFGWLLTSQHKSSLKPNVDFLLREGVTSDRISKFIVYQPRAAVQSHERVVKTVESVKRLGVDPKSALFIHAVRVMLSMNETNWNRKIEVLRSLGWSEEDVHSTFRKDPTCLGSSEEKIRKVMDFYLNTAKLDLEMIIKYPKFLTYGLDSRLRRRHKVIETLISKDLLKKNKANCWLFTLSEETFLKKYVHKNLQEIPDLMKIYEAPPEIEKSVNKKMKTIMTIDRR